MSADTVESLLAEDGYTKLSLAPSHTDEGEACEAIEVYDHAGDHPLLVRVVHDRQDHTPYTRFEVATLDGHPAAPIGQSRAVLMVVAERFGGRIFDPSGYGPLEELVPQRT